ncbi:MAG: immunity 53 family protein [Mesorhizobium sp.]|nr:immunity 53 family protein [Mesorhizobium sp.]MCO5160825.1 immunity 53 family protein [Mesorhizobium sp.]
MTDDALKWLEDWYSDQCDGDWEHQNGIDIGNIDNPGWTLKVDLTGTSLENIPFEEVLHNYDDEVFWWRCWRDAREFHAVCGARNLRSVIGVFRTWVEANQPK